MGLTAADVAGHDAFALIGVNDDGNSGGGGSETVVTADEFTELLATLAVLCRMLVT